MADPNAPAVVAPSYGVEHIEKILDVVVAGFEGYKSLKPEDNTMQKVSKFVPGLLVLAGALESFGKSGPEWKDLEPKEIEALRNKYLPKLGIDGKVGVYAVEGLNVVISAYKIIKAK